MKPIITNSRYINLLELANRTLLLIYVSTVPLASVQIFLGYSLSFIFAVLFFTFKLFTNLFISKSINSSKECFIVGILIIYLISGEYFIHNGDVFRAYFFTFSLNFIMFIALVDEFIRSPYIRKIAMVVLSSTIVVMASFMLFGPGGETSRAGRVTFLGLNENEMALSCLVAFTFFGVLLNHFFSSNIFVIFFVYAINLILIFSLISTGTRFTYIILIVQIFLFSIPNTLNNKSYSKSATIAASWLAFLIVSTLGSDVMINRLNPTETYQDDIAVQDPAREGSNIWDFGASASVLDMGGRSEMWINAAQAALSNPIFGLGYSGYENYNELTWNYFSLPHNFILEVAAIGGVIGITIIFILFTQISRRIYLHWKSTGSLIMLIWVLPVLGAAMFLNITHMKIVWILLAYIVTEPMRDRSVQEADTRIQRVF